MTKRALSLVTAILIFFSLICVPASAASKYTNIPILVGYGDVDYMAEQVLSEISIPEGNDHRAIIRAVYDWVIRNCSRDGWDGTVYFDEDAIFDQVSKYVEEANALLTEGNAVIRPELADAYSSDSWGASYDSNYYIAVFAHEMMMYRSGNCAHYSALLALLLGHLGYDCRLIPGEFINGDGSRVEHKWNCVLVNGRYYWLDVRMDHAIYARTGTITHDYFMVTSQSEWEEDHVWDSGYSDALFDNASEIEGFYNSVEHVHDLSYVPGIAPTCTENGCYSHYECTLCGKCYSDAAGTKPIDRDSVVRSALGHNWGSWEIIRECTFEEDGLRQRICRRDASHVETETFNDLYNPFADVASDAYYFRPILWALEQGITSGMDDSHFAPDQACTRAQVVTFLWRAAGSPEPSTRHTLFTDVKPSDYFYKAVLWAVEKGITSGMSVNRFAPNETCTRGQVVTFLWRYSGSPTVSGGYNPFIDVSSTDYYYSAIRWALRNSITAGLDDTHFGPNSSCTRGQVVTFLYRACA
ncbi:MAG: S-layer homology domain-containing protein [Oscillospiraceae bacterium]|nr:S-layer homology domain-containing protein [Oscillospiraceae bacterium]